MEDIFKTETIESFKKRIQELDDSSSANWGKMDLYQMLKHCTENDRMLLREKSYKRLFIGRLFGKLALKANIKDDKPLKKNGATHPELVITGSGDVAQQKQNWIDLLEKYPRMAQEAYQDFIHPFFGKMDRNQVSRFAYKHIDHHLRQFGV